MKKLQQNYEVMQLNKWERGASPDTIKFRHEDGYTVRVAEFALAHECGLVMDIVKAFPSLVAKLEQAEKDRDDFREEIAELLDKWTADQKELRECNNKVWELSVCSECGHQHIQK